MAIKDKDRSSRNSTFPYNIIAISYYDPAVREVLYQNIDGRKEFSR